jgi:hypothetical protein
VPLQYSGLFADFAVRVLADLTNGPIDPEATPAKEKAEPRDNSLPDAVLRDLIRVLPSPLPLFVSHSTLLGVVYVRVALGRGS